MKFLHAKNNPVGNDWAPLLPERILLLIGVLGVLGDSLMVGAFAPGSPEWAGNRILIASYSTVVFVLSLLSAEVRKRMYALTVILLYGFVIQISYLCHAYGFDIDYALMLHVAIIICSVYFRSVPQVLLFYVISFAVVAVSIYTAEAPRIPAERLLVRLVLAFAAGYGLFALTRSIGMRLRKSDERLRLLAEHSMDLIALHDLSGKLYYISPSVEDLLGYGPDGLAGRNAFDSIHPEDLPMAREIYYRGIVEEKRSVQMEYRLLRKDGTTVWVEVIGTPLIDPNGEIHSVLTTSRDIQERKRIEARNEEFRTTLIRTNKELDQFAYVVSHDLKAPLRGISYLATYIEEDLAEGRPQEEIMKNLVLMRSRVSRMEQLIDDILRYSRAGRPVAEPVSIDLNDMLPALVDSLALPEGFNVRIAGDLPRVRGARVHFEQIFTNLIDNAWRHHDKGSGEVRVSATSEKGFHRFIVEDDGPGIEPKHHERIFAAFQQLKSRDDGDGTGIGLAIVRKIVKGAGGEAGVSSSPGNGAQFWFTWPVKDPGRSDLPREKPE